MKKFIQGFIRIEIITYSVLMLCILFFLSELNIKQISFITVISYIMTSLVYNLRLNKEVTIYREVNSLCDIQLGEPVYELSGDEIIPYRPKSILATNDGVYVSDWQDFFESDKIRNIITYRSKHNYVYASEVDHMIESMKESFLSHTNFIPYKNFYKTYDEALEARNDKIRERIQKEVDKIEKI